MTTNEKGVFSVLSIEKGNQNLGQIDFGRSQNMEILCFPTSLKQSEPFLPQ